jgi:CheY-like chemotaxis protein
VTAHGNDRVERQLADHRIDGFVRKPFMPEQIRDALGRLLGEAGR